MRGHTARLGKGIFPSPLHPQDQGVPPVDPDRALRPGPDQRAFVPLGTQTGECPLDPSAAGHNSQEPRPLFRQRRFRPRGIRAPWNRDRGFGPGDDQGCFSPLEPVSLAADPAKGTALGTVCIRT